MRFIVNTLIALLCCLAAQAQDWNDYQPLMSSGDIPSEFLTPASQKYKLELAENNSGDKKQREQKSQFFLESNYWIDNTLLSGSVVFNDPISQYAEKVLDVLLKDAPELRQKIRIYTVRSSVVNAFATNQGIIFLNVGMLAQCETEAELAFILSHEISHIENKDALNLYIKLEDFERKAGDDRFLLKGKLDDKILKKAMFSKEVELTADGQGAERFLKTNYNLEAFTGVFDILRHSYLPYSELEFKKSFFETDYFKLPAAYYRDSVLARTGELEDEDDSRSTHPNIKTRKLGISNLFHQHQNEGRQDYIVSKSEFERVRDMARFELPMYHLHNEHFHSAIYYSYLLLEKNPDNLYAQKCIAKALYTMSKYRNAEYVEDIELDSIEGQLQRVAYLDNSMDDKEINLLATRYAWDLHKKFPNDNELKTIAEDALLELLVYHEFDIKNFSTTPVDISTIPPPDTTIQAPKGKKWFDDGGAQEIIKKEGGFDYFKYALVPYLQDSTFLNKAESLRKRSENRTKLKKYYASNKGKNALENERKEKEKKGAKLGLEKVVVVNPFYYKIDTRQENSMLFEASETARDEFETIITDNAKRVNLDVEMLNAASLSANETEKFNDLRMLNDWFAEQMDFDDLSITPGHRQANIDAIASKYNTDYFLWTGVVSMRKKQSYKWVFYSLFAFPTIPISMYHAIKPNYDSMYFSMVYNVKTGQRDVIKVRYFKHKDNKVFLNMHTYDALNQIRTPDK